jgi:hypothetical protein
MCDKLQRFNIARIKDASFIAIVGKTSTVKSFLVKDIMYYNRDIPRGTVISESESYGHFTPSIFIHAEYSPELVNKVIRRQEALIKSDKDARAMFIIDNSPPKCIGDKTLCRLFGNMRKYHLLIIITMHARFGLRTNVDYAFIFHESDLYNRKLLYECYAYVFPSFKMFCSAMDRCTEYRCLVIIINSRSKKFGDRVFWYHAEAHEDFKVGDEDYWLRSAETT